MKIMQTSILNKDSSDILLSTQEPVILENKKNPVGVFLSIHDFKDFLNTTESIKQEVNTGIIRGIEDSKAGRITEGNQDFIDDLERKLEERLSSNK